MSKLITNYESFYGFTGAVHLKIFLQQLLESVHEKKRQNIFEYSIVLKYISKTFYIIFLKQILSAFICSTLNVCGMFTLGARSDFVERGRFRAW